MHRSRRIAAMFALATAAMGVAATTATPAVAAPNGPQPVSDWLPAIRAEAGSWVNIFWRTDRPICDAEVWVRGDRGVRIEYPGARRSAEFSRGDSLSPRRTDFTRVRVTTGYPRGGVASLQATISYDYCGPLARTQTRTAELSLPVLRNTWPGGQQGPGDPGTGHPGGPRDQGGPSGPAHGNPPQGNPTQGNPSQGNPPRGNAPQGNPSQGSPSQGNPPQGNPSQGNPPRGNAPQGNPGQGQGGAGQSNPGGPNQGGPGQGGGPRAGSR
ncbi:hypothetical protein [Actinoplanes sp. NPDC051851]|uniref:hypothetical protein n=1 Tax=Actinoplanes sp. NPDC051851 TaxID=3154753 RepID=UPI00341D6707